MLDPLKQYEVAQALKRRRNLSEKEIKVMKQTVVKPTENDLKVMGEGLDNIRAMTEQAHDSSGQRQHNLLHRIQHEKQNLDKVISKYTQFQYEVPVSYHYVTKVFDYNKIDKSVQHVIDELDSIRLPGIEEVEKRKLIFGDFK
ncbi:hypothetical protein AAA450_11745 [Staphylococcus equorum]|uniref:hypothetical protein n=1 Tax=Staphylococcus equorum TaxID=246432 RepID=UPI003D804370